MIFDTNRAWCSKLPTLVRLFPEAKVICCVRHVGWIMDSIERLIRENAFELSGIFGFESLNTVSPWEQVPTKCKPSSAQVMVPRLT